MNIRGKFQGAESAFSRLFLRFANLAKYDSSCKLFSTGSEIHSTAAPEARKMIELQTLRNGIPCSVFLYFVNFENDRSSDSAEWNPTERDREMSKYVAVAVAM